MPLRHPKSRAFCRNPKCHAKLDSPEPEPLDQFCCKGCFQRHYRLRCLTCEATLPSERSSYCRPPKPCRQRARRPRLTHWLDWTVSKGGKTTELASDPSSLADGSTNPINTGISFAENAPLPPPLIGPRSYPIELFGARPHPDAPTLPAGLLTTILTTERPARSIPSPPEPG